MKRAAALVLVMLAMTASAAVDARALASEGQKAQWAPTRNFSTLNAHPVFAVRTPAATSPYAGEAGKTAAAAKEAGFTGHRVESALGLTYAQQRWLDSSTGTWLSRDDIGAASYLQSPNELNPWLYAASNPSRFTDPSGRDVLDLLDPAKPLPKGALDSCSSGGRACPVEEASEGSARAAQQAQKFNSAQPMPSGQPLQQMPVSGPTPAPPSAVAVGVTTVAGVGLSIEQMRAQNKLKAQLNANRYSRRCYSGDQEDCAILKKRIADGDWPQPANPALIPGVATSGAGFGEAAKIELHDLPPPKERERGENPEDIYKVGKERIAECYAAAAQRYYEAITAGHTREDALRMAQDQFVAMCGFRPNDLLNRLKFPGKDPPKGERGDKPGQVPLPKTRFAQ